jgi:hypothetical protein
MKEGKKEEKTDYKKTKNSRRKQSEIIINTDIIKKYVNTKLEKDGGGGISLSH